MYTVKRPLHIPALITVEQSVFVIILRLQVPSDPLLSQTPNPITEGFNQPNVFLFKLIYMAFKMGVEYNALNSGV